MSSSLKPAMAETAHDFSFTAITGELLPLDQFRGKVVLVVNTASRCGFTPQYDDLQAVYEAYRDRGWWCWGCRAMISGVRNSTRPKRSILLRGEFQHHLSAG